MSNQIIKKIQYGEESQKSLHAGIEKLAKAVRVTLGPQGRHVLIEKPYGPPHVTKDGVTVAQSVFFEDHFENMGAALIKEAASQTARVAGDGTTTATVLAFHFVEEGLKLIQKGFNPVKIAKVYKRLATQYSQWIRDNLAQTSISEKECCRIAVLAANNDEILGNIIGKAVYEVGPTTPIIPSPSSSTKSYYERVDGYLYSSGYIHPHYINDPTKGIWKGEFAKLLICKKTIADTREIENILRNRMGNAPQKQMNTNPNALPKEVPSHKKEGDHKPLLIITGPMNHKPSQLLLLNQREHHLYAGRICVTNFPTMATELNEAILEDLAVLTGATIATTSNCKQDFPIPDDFLGDVELAIVSDRESMLTVKKPKDKARFQQHVDSLRARAENEKDPEKKKEFLARADKLVNGVIKLYIGGENLFDVRSQLDLADDAIRASSCALEEGIVPGGGISYFQVMKNFRDNTQDEIEKSFTLNLLQPLNQMLINSGISSEKGLDLLKTSTGPTWGINLASNDDELKLVDLREEMIIDPLKVICIALEKAAHVAATILTTGAIISDHTDLYQWNMTQISAGQRMLQSVGV